MKKIKITQEQYNRLIISEQKRFKDEILIFENEELLEEGFKEVVLGIAMLAGLSNNLDAQQQKIGKSALKDAKTVEQVNDYVKDKEGIKDLADELASMKIKNVDVLVNKISKNAKTFGDNFEKLAPEDYGQNKDIIVTNLKVLPSYIERGYSVKGVRHTIDTVKTQNKVDTIQIKETINFKMGNMGEMFVSGGFELSEKGIKAIDENMKFLTDNGFEIENIRIIASTDKQRIKSLSSEEDKTGNVELANRRINSVKSIIKNYEIASNANIIDKPLPNQGKYEASDFAAAEGTSQLSTLQNETQENRFVRVEVDVKKTIKLKDGTTKPDKVVEKWQVVLTNNYEKTHKVKDINRHPSDVIMQKKSSCEIIDNIAKCSWK